MLLFIRDALNCSKVTVKLFIMLKNISISNKYCSFKLSVSIKKYEAAQHLIIIRNVSGAAYYYDF